MEENSEDQGEQRHNTNINDTVDTPAVNSFDYEDIRSKFSRSSNEQVSRDRTLRLSKWLIGILVVIAAFGLLIFVFVQSTSVYRNNQTAIAATQFAETLEVKVQNADNFIRMGNPAQALTLYKEVKQLDPAYPGMDAKIKEAENFIQAMELYKKGIQFLGEEKYDKALETFSTVEQLRHNYLDTLELIQRLEHNREIAGLVVEIKNNYSSGNWVGVIRNYEAILELDPFIELPELKEMIFKSYRNEIFALSTRNDLTLEEIEIAEGYYRKAIAMVPQDKEYSKDREELKKIASEIIANKYFLDALVLLEDSNYSYEGFRRAVPIMRKAEDLSGASFLIETEMEKAELFLEAYDDLLLLDWNGAIEKLEVLLRRDKNYAGGRARYFLYEAYINRGDMLKNYSDFEAAFLDYQEAEKLAWDDKESPLRLFQSQIRVAKILEDLNKIDGAAEYYDFAFNQLGYENILVDPDAQELLEILGKARQSFLDGDFVGAVEFYGLAVDQQQLLFDQKIVPANKGDLILSIAFEQGVTIEFLGLLNNFGKAMILDADRDLFVPVLYTSSR